jgi:hypothetical protein
MGSMNPLIKPLRKPRILDELTVLNPAVAQRFLGHNLALFSLKLRHFKAKLLLVTLGKSPRFF